MDVWDGYDDAGDLSFVSPAAYAVLAHAALANGSGPPRDAAGREYVPVATPAAQCVTVW